jgi:hypothetical protein
MRHVWLFVLLLSAVPVFAQDSDEAALRSLGMGGIYASGNLALKDIDRSSSPVKQLRTFFEGSGVPLTAEQERELESVVQNQQVAVDATNHSPEAIRRVNAEYMRKVIAVLTADQQSAWKRYRNEFIKTRGGFPALKLILEEAGTPFTADQERQIQTLYTTFNQRVGRLTLESNGRPDLDVLSAMQSEQLTKVVQLLDDNQKKALADSHHTLMSSHVKPRR